MLGGARLGRASGGSSIATSSEQLAGWAAELGCRAARVRRLAINEVVPDLPVEGPVPELAERVRELQRRFFAR